MLEIFGRSGFDTANRTQEEFERLCKHWVRHVRDGEPVPGSDGLAPLGPSWGGVTQFMAVQRDQEQAHVLQMGQRVNAANASLEELKDTLRDFAQGLRSAVTKDQASDSAVIAALDSLGQLSATSNDLGALRTKIVATVTIVKDSIESRQQRHAVQIEQLGRELVAVKAELATASIEAETDGLTDLYNRKALDAQLERTVSLCQMTGRPTCVLMVDLDNFKHINDTYGHPAGDKALQALGNTLRTVVLRKSDFVARYGGDEFTVILNNCRLSAARFIADRLLATVREIRIETDAGEFGFTVSMGVAELGAREGREGWLQRADLNLLAAKRAGRDQVK